jgi:hypothetical protein
MAISILPRPRSLAFALCSILLCLTLRAHAESSSLPESPKPHAVFTKTDWVLAAGVYATHVGDYLSTESCVHGTRCREEILPQALVHRGGAFAAYEFGTASLEVLGQYEMTKLGHPRLARAIQSLNITFTTRTVANNYELAWHTPRPHMGGL